MPEDGEIVETVQEYCKELLFERKTQGKAIGDDYKQSWLEHAKTMKGMEIREERLTDFTTKSI